MKALLWKCVNISVSVIALTDPYLMDTRRTYKRWTISSLRCCRQIENVDRFESACVLSVCVVFCVCSLSSIKLHSAQRCRQHGDRPDLIATQTKTTTPTTGHLWNPHGQKKADLCKSERAKHVHMHTYKLFASSIGLVCYFIRFCVALFTSANNRREYINHACFIESNAVTMSRRDKKWIVVVGHLRCFFVRSPSVSGVCVFMGMANRNNNYTRLFCAILYNWFGIICLHFFSIKKLAVWRGNGIQFICSVLLLYLWNEMHMNSCAPSNLYSTTYFIRRRFKCNYSNVTRKNTHPFIRTHDLTLHSIVYNVQHILLDAYATP